MRKRTTSPQQLYFSDANLYLLKVFYRLTHVSLRPIRFLCFAFCEFYVLLFASLTMTQTISEYLCYFSFGMLFSAQIICTGFMYYKGKTHSLQKAVFIFMAYLLAISAFELVFSLFTQHRGGPSDLTPYRHTGNDRHTGGPAARLPDDRARKKNHLAAGGKCVGIWCGLRQLLDAE